MSEEQSGSSFSERMTRQLTADTRDLWMRMAGYFDGEGPEAVTTYLDAQRDLLEGRVRERLQRFKEV